MGVYEQLNDADQRAVSQLSRYLIETPGNRFYEQNLVAVRNHIAGNEQLIAQAHKFQEKLAQMLSQQAKAVTTITEKVQKVAADPVKEMMSRYQDPAAPKKLAETIKKVQKQRAIQKKIT